MTATHNLPPTQLPAWRQLAQLAAQPQPHLRERLQAPERSAMQAAAEADTKAAEEDHFKKIIARLESIEGRLPQK